MRPLVGLVVAYLVGAIPVGLLVARARGLGDIRRHGSGNIGATNVLRTMGRGAAAVTLIGDVAKGVLAVWLGSMVSPGVAPAAAVAAVVGNCWPVFLRFRGGKGVATGLGALLALVPLAVAPAALVWIAIAATFRYVSLASVLAALCVPLGAVMLAYPWPSVGACAIIAAIILVRHRENIGRLLSGTERRLGEHSGVIAAILGAGSWGTALALHLGRCGVPVRLWARDPAIVAGIATRRRNPYYLEDIELPEPVAATADLVEAVAGVDVMLIAVPSEFVARTLKAVPALAVGAVAVSATKGFDSERHLRMSQVIRERFPEHGVAVLSGPTFAREVAQRQPTAAVVAADDEALATRLRDAWGTREFRLYTNRDVAGVEIGGAMKNAIALATGLSDGLGLGENARAALITRGLAEITRLGVALGARAATLAGLSGLGDLILTCTGSLSRNRALGMALARGRSLAEAQRATRMVAEGVPTVRAALVLARSARVSVPICTAVGGVLFEGRSPREALAALLARAATREDAPHASGAPVGEPDA